MEEPPARLARDLLQYFPTVGMPRARNWHGTAHSSAAPDPAEPAHSGVAVRLRIFKKNRIHQRVRPLRHFDATSQTHLASGIHPVRKNDQRLPSGLLLHDLVRPEQHRVVQVRSAAAPTAPLSASTGIPAT